jgi:arylsulfate sulfotransferase
MNRTRSATGCLAADDSRDGLAILARAVAVCFVVTVSLAGASGCSGGSSNNVNGTGGRGTGGALMGSAASAGTSDVLEGSAGVPLGTGGVLVGSGGAQLGGAASAGTSGVSGDSGGVAGTSGVSVGSAGVSVGSGGVAASTGGASGGSGGASGGSGGASGGSGGVSVGSGGASGGSGGVSAGSGGASVGSGGASAGDASVPVELSGYDVEVDPYGTSPLVAVVNLRGVEANEVQSVQVVVTGQDGGQDFVRTYSPTDTDLVVNMDTSDLTFPEAGYHVPVLGLYADRENVVRILVDVLDRGRVDLALKINTSLSKPDEAAWVPSIRVETAVADLMEPGWTVAEISIEPNPNPPIVFVDWTRTIAFDERGAIRWALRMDLPKGETFTLKRSVAGNFLTGSFDTIVEVTKLGRIVRTFQLSDYTLNHEIVQIGSEANGEGVSGGPRGDGIGAILVLASKNDASTIQDHILELDSDSGELLDVWDLAQVFDPTRRTYIDAEKWDISQNGDWLHDNGLAYSQADESIIVSGRHQGVAKIRRDGTLVWLLAPHKGWNEPQSGKLLTAVSATLDPYADAVQLGDQAAGTASTPEFDWPFGQHSPTLLPNGDLLLFDNGASRHFSGFCGSFSRAVIYRVDEAAMTVRQIGQFIFSKSESSCYCSNTHRLPVTGNIFIQPALTGSDTAVAKEVTTQVADDGTITFDKVVFEATLSLVFDKSRWWGYSYRGHRWTF